MLGRGAKKSLYETAVSGACRKCVSRSWRRANSDMVVVTLGDYLVICLFFYKYTCYVTRRVTDLLDDGSTFCVGQLFGANPNIVHRGPCLAGAWGVLPTYGLLGKLTVLCPL